MTIINIRGGNASGKSWVVRNVIAPYARETMLTDGKKIEGYRVAAPQPLFVIGKYEEANTGGADTFKDMDEVVEIVKRRSGTHVLFEGIRVHGAHQRWVDLGVSGFLPKEAYRFIVLSTTPAQSRAYMLARRAAVGDERPLSPATLESIEDHYRRGRRQLRHFTRAGLWVKEMASGEAVQQIREWIA